MRISASLLIPLTLITFYYLFWVAVVAFLLNRFPGLGEYFPIGGVDDLGEEMRVTVIAAGFDKGGRGRARSSETARRPGDSDPDV